MQSSAELLFGEKKAKIENAHILVVEDNFVNQKIIIRLLTNLGKTHI
jgi:hypothetical protein